MAWVLTLLDDFRFWCTIKRIDFVFSLLKIFSFLLVIEIKGICFSSTCPALEEKILLAMRSACRRRWCWTDRRKIFFRGISLNTNLRIYCAKLVSSSLHILVTASELYQSILPILDTLFKSWEKILPCFISSLLLKYCRFFISIFLQTILLLVGAESQKFWFQGTLCHS
jgi:hypothetical protein